MLQLWRHECTRVLCDRFITSLDHEWFVEKMKELVKEELPDHCEQFPQDEHYFVDFLQDAPEPGDDTETLISEYFVYDEIESTKERILMFMAQYNNEIREAKLDLILFKDALVNLMRISRIIRTAR